VSTPGRLGSIVVAAVSACFPCGANAQDLPSVVVGAIEVVNQEVFEEEGARLTAVYRFANKLHVRTRERVVARELLFESGDLVDRELLEQTERNLRALPFFRDAPGWTRRTSRYSCGHVGQVVISAKSGPFSIARPNALGVRCF
jgi:hypothetical protein